MMAKFKRKPFEMTRSESKKRVIAPIFSRRSLLGGILTSWCCAGMAEFAWSDPIYGGVKLVVLDLAILVPNEHEFGLDGAKLEMDGVDYTKNLLLKSSRISVVPGITFQNLPIGVSRETAMFARIVINLRPWPDTPSHEKILASVGIEIRSGEYRNTMASISQILIESTRTPAKLEQDLTAAIHEILNRRLVRPLLDANR